jgi:hypothetical protein
MKKTSLLAAALLLAACAETTDPAVAFRDALPSPEAAKVDTYRSEAIAAKLAVAEKGDSAILQSEYAVMSYYLALTVNSGVAWSLGLVQLVVAYPPTSCVEDVSCTWGPWIDDQGLNRWQLTVAKAGDAYAWALAAQPGSAPTADFASILSGTAYPVERNRGSGTFTIDFDAEATLDHGGLWEQHDFGRIVVDYDNTSDVRVDALFTGARKDDDDQDPSNDHLMDAIYSFQDAASGGELQVAFHDLDTTEQVSLRTRWSAGGAGRADAHYVGPDGMGGTANYYATECWAGHAQDFEEVYDSKFGIGTESLCSPFSQADYADVVLPE